MPRKSPLRLVNTLRVNTVRNDSSRTTATTTTTMITTTTAATTPSETMAVIPSWSRYRILGAAALLSCCALAMYNIHMSQHLVQLEQKAMKSLSLPSSATSTVVVTTNSTTNLPLEVEELWKHHPPPPPPPPTSSSSSHMTFNYKMEQDRLDESFNNDYNYNYQSNIGDDDTVKKPLDADVLPRIDWKHPMSTIGNSNQIIVHKKNLDIGVPVAGQDDKLITFLKCLTLSIHTFRKLTENTQLTIRILITRYPQDDNSIQHQEQLAKQVGMDNMDQIIFVSATNHTIHNNDNKKNETMSTPANNNETTTTELHFHRAVAINMLHKATQQDEYSVLAIVDVDMDIGPRFIYNALTLVNPQQVYFPIVFSQYRPSNVQLVELFLGPLSKYSEHRGLWRHFGYGMYAMSGTDVTRFTMDETFQGWGGEDSDFYKRVRQTPGITINRQNEYDLVHRWHAKYCDLDGFVEPENLRTCITSQYRMEGSNFGHLLVELDSTRDSNFKYLLASSPFFSRMVAAFYQSKLYSMYEISATRRKSRLAVIHMLAEKRSSLPLSQSRNDHTPAKVDGILIGVTASRQTFSTRVAEVVKTWANRLPPGVFVRFYVGDLVEPATYASGSPEDIANLAAESGIADNSTIVVMNGVVDDEYPLVNKASAILRHMGMDIRSLEQDQIDVKWVFDVDDDTYVNIAALQHFLSKRSPNDHAYIGQRGSGAKEDRKMLRKGGLVKPYCMGGTGILMSRPTFGTLVDHVDECMESANTSQTVVYDDVVFGMCVYRHLGLSCWDEWEYRKDVFAHNYGKLDNFPRASRIRKTITVHPHKTPGMMTKTYERFRKFG